MDSLISINYFLSVKSAWIRGNETDEVLRELAGYFYLNLETLKDLI